METRLILVPLLLILVGVLILAGAMPSWLAARKSRKWPSVEGRIIEAQEVRGKGSVDGSRNAVSMPQVEYVYTVEGKKHQGRRVVHGTPLLWSTRRVLRRYPKGKVCPVFYHPRQPKLAILEPGAKLAHSVFPGLGVGCLLVGVFALLLTN